jgi:hypothetical protein
MSLFKFKTCVEACTTLNESCPNNDCGSWIDYEDDLNCMNVAIENNGAMTLRDVADRLKYSFVRIKQIEDDAKQKIKEQLDNEYYL